MFGFVRWLLRQIVGIIALINWYELVNWLVQRIVEIVPRVKFLWRLGKRIIAPYRRLSATVNWVIGVFAALVAWCEFWVEFDVANPLTDPVWFAEDLLLLGNWALTDYIYPLRAWPTAWYGGLAYIVGYYIFWVTLKMLSLRRSYLEYLGLGRGARPSTVGGWLTHECLTWTMNALGIDVLSKPFLDPYEDPYNGLLQVSDLPERTQPRPQIVGLGPVKQVTETNRSMAALFQQDFEDLVRTHQGTLQSVPHGARTGLPTLRLNPEALPAPWGGLLNSRLEWGGEVAHIRPDGGLEVDLHPGDADEVVQRGWGQRHPLAVLNEVWLWRFLYHSVLRTSTPVPSSSVIVYAPLDQEQRNVVVRIVEAGVWWAEL